jgi:hypothetical protein
MTQRTSLKQPVFSTSIGGGIFLGVFGFLWCSFVFFFDGMLAWNAVQQVRATSFATTTGAITHSELKVEHDSDGVSFHPEVRYRYAVDGQPFEGKRVRYDSSALDRAHSQAIVDRYSSGQAVVVHYDSATPQEAVLELGLDSANLAALLFMMPFNALALGFIAGLVAWIRSMRLGRPVLGISVRNDGLGKTIRIYEFSPAVFALAAGGGAGFVSTFGYLLFTIMFPFEVALALAWLVTIGAATLGWWYGRRRYIEIRRDALRSRIELRATDGSSYFVLQENIQPVQYARRMTKDSDGDDVERFPLTLPFVDPASQQAQALTLPEQTTEADAKQFATWLNGVLGVTDA